MKKLILTIALLFSFISFSQDTTRTDTTRTPEKEIFDQEWYDKVDSPLEYVIFKNPRTGYYSIRVYRGDATEHQVRIKDYYGKLVYAEIIGRDAELDLFFLPCAYYIIELENEDGVVAQIIRIR